MPGRYQIDAAPGKYANSNLPREVVSYRLVRLSYYLANLELYPVFRSLLLPADALFNHDNQGGLSRNCCLILFYALPPSFMLTCQGGGAMLAK